jgi:SpoVK/Ycf46/Vps4 family AAA+-type ATPase
MIEKRILIVAATNFLDVIDPAVIRPGRFDLKIPIFPPNHKERIELICHELLNELSPNSKLREILVWNKADIQEFWIDYSTRMNLYSNSLIVDFTQLLKKRLRNIYKREQTIEIRMTDELLTGIIEDTSAKITSKDVEFYSQFYNEVKKLSETTYSERLRFLFSELSVYFGRNKKDAPRPIGFRNPRYES